MATSLHLGVAMATEENVLKEGNVLEEEENVLEEKEKEE